LEMPLYDKKMGLISHHSYKERLGKYTKIILIWNKIEQK